MAEVDKKVDEITGKDVHWWSYVVVSTKDAITAQNKINNEKAKESLYSYYTPIVYNNQFKFVEKASDIGLEGYPEPAALGSTWGGTSHVFGDEIAIYPTRWNYIKHDSYTPPAE